MALTVVRLLWSARLSILNWGINLSMEQLYKGDGWGPNDLKTIVLTRLGIYGNNVLGNSFRGLTLRLSIVVCISMMYLRVLSTFLSIKLFLSRPVLCIKF